MSERPLIRRGGEEGSVAVEMAITLSALLLLVFGAIQFALVFWNWNTMLLAAEEAGRYTMLYNPTMLGNTGITLADVCPSGAASVTLPDCAVAWADQNYGSLYDITYSGDCTDAGGDCTFTATYKFEFLNSVSLSRSIQVPVI